MRLLICLLLLSSLSAHALKTVASDETVVKMQNLRSVFTPKKYKQIKCAEGADQLGLKAESDIAFTFKDFNPNAILAADGKRNSSYVYAEFYACTPENGCALFGQAQFPVINTYQSGSTVKVLVPTKFVGCEADQFAKIETAVIRVRLINSSIFFPFEMPDELGQFEIPVTTLMQWPVGFGGVEATIDRRPGGPAVGTAKVEAVN